MSISQKSEIPNRITDLIETFHYNLDSYKKGNYNETQVRREFIDPFFEELGWDITNKQGYAEGYKDVIHEDAIKVGGITKAPDYCFRIGGTRKFFLMDLQKGQGVYSRLFDLFKDAFPQIKVGQLKTLPIRPIDFNNPTDKSLHDQMLSLVQLMLDLHKKLNESNLQQERTVITRQIEATDRQIDQLVYKLYDLTDDEIKIVEGKQQ